MCTNLAAWLIEYSNIAIITGNQLDLFDLRSHLANNVETCSPQHDGNEQRNNRNTVANLRLPLFHAGFHHVVYLNSVPTLYAVAPPIWCSGSTDPELDGVLSGLAARCLGLLLLRYCSIGGTVKKEND